MGGSTTDSISSPSSSGEVELGTSPAKDNVRSAKVVEMDFLECVLVVLPLCAKILHFLHIVVPSFSQYTCSREKKANSRYKSERRFQVLRRAVLQTNSQRLETYRSWSPITEIT